ncbi:Rne/Rng family ribonuclease [Paludisphaera rhizosphaerae]|uniref:Rne/Rng family ribonuclease n=1 Tax=Paludisphaera rhizosphaerae TaxID=2711216 RepID=UPI00197E4641|nr:Rne/Rng family ribonuclease [Paludisphaera rhizosphaerae]
MKKEMLINVLQPEECRIAIIENGVLEELYVERTSHESYTGNIYKGKIVNLEPAIQAAFVDFSVGRNGFLHVSDVEAQYYDRHGASADDEGDDFEPPAPPRSREPSRDRDREPRRRDRDRDRDRERPDLSVKGRRDRSESPRNFGEGLVEGHDDDFTPPPPPEAHREPAFEDEDRGRGREAGPTSWSKSTEYDRDVESDPLESRWGRTSRRDEPEPAEADLPPNRTARRQSPTPPAEPEPDLGLGFERDDRGRPRSLFGDHEPAVARGRGPAREVEREPLPEREPEREDSFEPAPSPSRRERPRRGNGRGRASRPPVPEEETLEPVEFEAPSPVSDEEPSDFGSEAPPRRRGGRAAIRSRGGDRPDLRPREVVPTTPPPAAEPPAPPSRRTRPAAEIESPYRSPAEPEVERERDRERPERPSRQRAHDRAGEPGYVPRRERLKTSDYDFGDQPAPRGYEPPEDDVRGFGAGVEEEVEAEAEAEGEGETESGTGRSEGRTRRRRRRGRRRDRERPESLETPSTADESADVADEEEEVSFREPARRRPSSRLEREDVDVFDDLIGDADDLHDHDHDDAPPAVEEEIDPELEQEIRKEIEEIEVLEREMGLRGPVEARPHRGEGRGGRGASKPPIQEVFRRGDEVLVQCIKESIGTKGPTLSTYISIPGRYLVLMPGLNRVGVSRKIVDEGQRRKLREIMHELNPPKGLGFIVRTAGLERSKRELARDLAYLLRLWKVILRRIKKTKGPAPIYQESDMITRTIRDVFTSEIDTIWIDEPAAFERAQEFLRVVMPRFANRVKLYDEKIPLFHKYGIEDEIAKIQRRHVPLPEGGSIVIDQTEALVAIDVNSGNFRVEDDAERTAYEMNLRAAKEIARQLRLRDLGGVIVNDFIDMREERHRRGVERALREAIKRDRARTKVLRMSAFGLIEMTRQRIRPSLKRSVYEDCPNCNGAGVVKSAESMAIDVMRIIALASHREDVRKIQVTVGSAVATYLNNRKRKAIARIEAETGMSVMINFKEGVAAEHLQIECFDANNGEVRVMPSPSAGHHHHRRGH